MKILVVGCGSIGNRHINNLKIISDLNIIIYDKNPVNLDKYSNCKDVIICKSLIECWKHKPYAVLVCTPPNDHINLSLSAIKHNAHVFIEKPISNNIQGIDNLLQLAHKKNLKIFVGYNFRFHPGIKYINNIIKSGIIGKILSARAEFGQYLPDWRPWQDYKKSYTAKIDLGGGIILDGSHELDYLRWFFGEPNQVFCFADKNSNLEVETEDLAEILIKFKNNVMCEVHLDFIRADYTRNCELIGEKGVINWDYKDNIVKYYKSSTKKWNKIKLSFETNDMYLEEMRHFFRVITNNEMSLSDGYNGKKTLELALAAKESASKNKKVIL